MLRLRASTNCVIRHGLLLSAPVGRHGLSLSAQFFGATETLSVPSIRKLSTTLGSAEEPKDRRAPAVGFSSFSFGSCFFIIRNIDEVHL